MSSALDEVLEGFEPSPQIVSVMTQSRPAVVLGLDIGTSGIRAALFDERGEDIASASVRLPWPAVDNTTSFNAERRLAWIEKAIDDLFGLARPIDLEIQLISISCFWHSLVGVDENGDSTTPVFTWAGTEATDAAQEMRGLFDEPSIQARTGCRFHPSYWPAKLRWLNHKHSEDVAATRYWISFGEFLVLHLCGETAASISMASATGLFHQQLCEWDAELLDLLNLRLETLPQLAASHTTFSELKEKYAVRWPELSEASVFPAIGDGAADAIGSGCTTRSNLALMVGSSGALRLMYRGEPPAQIPPELWCYRADDKRVILGGALSDGGNLYAWLRESLLDVQEKWIENSLAELEPDAHGLTILPFWAGERSTGWSLKARGAILGLTNKTQPIEILRAAMEAVAYRFALIHRALAPFAPDAAIIASGTALRASPAWLQILADVLGTPITLSTTSESSTRGAALLALEAAGKIANIETRKVAAGTTFEPDLSRHARYQVGLERQQKIYDQLFNET
jgi:gluconokinase